MEGENKTPIVHLKDVVIGFNSSKPLVEITNMEIFPGEVVAVTGPSGIGKTTLLRTIAGLVKPISGYIQVCGSNPSQILRGEVGYIPQRLGLVRHASVLHNVMLGAKTNQKLSKSYFSSRSEKEYSIKKINSMGLTEKTNEPVRRLSGGQQRRVAIARTLSQAPSLIMADEFLSELDEKTINMVLREILDYVRNSKAALLVVEHDVSRAKEMADHLLVIDDGRVNPFISETRTILLEAEK